MDLVTISLFSYHLQKSKLAILKEPLILNSTFRNTLEIIENSGDNFFITGRAGTGKSTLLRLFKEITKKKIVVLAPTGVAALNVGGQTIHSFFKLMPGLLLPSEIHKSRNTKYFKNIDTIIIDEISMVRADLLDNIDFSLRLNRNSPLPFGGVQMIFFGDLFQIPPVVSNNAEKSFIIQNYESPYFFSSNIYKSVNNFIYIELKEVFRQTDRLFINLLESIRTNEMDWEQLEELNQRFQPDIIDEGNYITLSSRNSIANELNNRKLEQIDSPIFLYQSVVEGEFPSSIFPVDQTLALKVGAQVMFQRNDPDRKYVNGTIGTVTYLDDLNIEVEITENGKSETVDVISEIWENKKYKINQENHEKLDQEIIGRFIQFPLRLAWAITIHKSQGKTFNNVVIDMGSGAFTHGMTYVALSRCRSLEGIILNTPIKPKDIMVDPTIVDFLDQIKRS